MLHSPTIEFHLECEGAVCLPRDDSLWQDTGADNTESAATRPDVLVVPPGDVCFLTSSADEDRRPLLTLEAPEGPAVLLEPLIFDGRPVLAAVRPPGDESRVNATFMPRPAVLSAGDRLQLPHGPVLRVRMFSRPEIGPPPAELVGKLCGYCRTPIIKKTTIFVCHNCGIGLHCEDTGPPEKRLRCAQLSSVCPRCTHPVLLKEGYITSPLSREMP